MTVSGFVVTADAFGRPLALRVGDVAAVEGAIDAHDGRGDLWAQHPPGPYRRVTLVSGFQLHVDASDRALLEALDLGAL